MNALKTSITRMKQLGLVDVEKMPELHPDPKNPHKVDIAVEVKELNRQSVNFSAGYSGYDGLFLTLGYSTRNFLGAGETMAVNLQTGTRIKNYSASYTEPYLFNLPANLGFSVNKTSQDYTYLSRKSTGFGISSSARLWGYLNASLGYSFQDVESTAVDDSGITLDSYLDQLYNYNGTISALTSTIYYSSVDSPLFPTRGTKLLFSYKYSGGFLGGDVNLHKTKFQLLKFFPVWKRHVLGFQLVHQALIPIGDDPIPLMEKFLLGEQGIRGFAPYQITPRNENGDALGGNKAIYMNLQYEIPLNRQFSTILFYDIGNAYDFGQAISLKNVYSSAGVELKVFIPMLNVPFRLIFAYNPRISKPGDSHFQFRFTVGTAFH
jgi:outer membrane protein insertion porin family